MGSIEDETGNLKRGLRGLRWEVEEVHTGTLIF